MPASIINFSDTTPVAGAGKINGKWQNDGGSSTVNVSVELPDPIVELVTFTGTSGTLAHTPTKILGGFRNGVRMDASSGSPEYTNAGSAITLAIAAGGSDVFIFVYFF